MEWTHYGEMAAAATVALAAGAVAGRAYFWPRSQMLFPVIWHGTRSDPPRVALTFDDGPSPETTPAVLDALGELGVPAAFFVIGVNAQRHPGIVHRMAAEGHLVGNHTFHHPHLGLFGGRAYWERELTMTDDFLAAMLGRRPALFRPPMGFKSGFMAQGVRRHGQAMVTWTRRAFDGLPTTAQRIIQRLVPHTAAGDILALHDGVEPNVRRSQKQTVAAIRPLIAGLRARGLTLVRLDELIQRPGYLALAAGAP